MKSSPNLNRDASRFRLLSRLLAAEGRPGEKLETLLAELARAFGLEQAGFRWPAAGAPKVQCVAGKPDGLPRWDADTTNRLTSARSSSEIVADPLTPGRVAVPVLLEGVRNGVLWASARELTEEDREGLVVAAQCLGRHPAVAERAGVCREPARTAQRLEDAASVAGKIAHDFDNIFTGVVGFAEMLQAMLEPDSLLRQYVTEIASAGNRGIQFTQQLHHLSRSGAAKPMPTRLTSVTAREEARLKKKSEPAVRLQFSVPADLPPVAAESGALQAVLGHLLDNAVEASPPGGTVRVAAELIELSEAEAREFLGAAAAGPYVAVSVADEGPGVREDYRPRLFVEPFFTTKVRHRGLGLPVAYRILAAHRGGARYSPGPDRGSVFQIVIPLAAARGPDAPAAREVTRTPGGSAL
jgi:signal transduction histidine kinase